MIWLKKERRLTVSCSKIVHMSWLRTHFAWFSLVTVFLSVMVNKMSAHLNNKLLQWIVEELLIKISVFLISFFPQHCARVRSEWLDFPKGQTFFVPLCIPSPTHTLACLWLVFRKLYILPICSINTTDISLLRNTCNFRNN